MTTRIFLTAGVAGLICAPALAAPAGPWAQVPALPTACEQSQDAWGDKSDAATHGVQETLYAQQEKNAAVQEKFNRANENPMAMSQAMQRIMMEDPQDAQKLIEQMVQAGQQAQTEVPAQSEKEKQIEAESKTLLEQYDSALDIATKPALARWNALQKKMG